MQCSPVVRSVVAFLAVAASITASAQTPSNPQLQIRKVAENVYAALPAPGSDLSANSGFVVGENGVWVFDALRPEAVAELKAEIRKVTPVPVKYVLNSHYHYELVLGNASFSEATIVAHENTRRNLIRNPPPAQVERTKASLERLGLPPEERRADVALRVPDLTYRDRLVFYDGDREVHIIHLGRYHTDGDSVLYLPKEKVLFSGDLLPGLGGPGGQRDAHFREFITSIDRALALDFEIIVPGRGDTLATKDDLRRFQQYLKEVIAGVQGFVDRGATLEDTQAGFKPPAYIDQKRVATPSFQRLWADTIRRAYEELKGGNPKSSR